VELWDFRIQYDRLNDWEKYLIYLHLYEDMSSREIAELCGYAKSSVHEHLTSVLSKLRSE